MSAGKFVCFLVTVFRLYFVAGEVSVKPFHLSFPSFEKFSVIRPQHAWKTLSYGRKHNLISMSLYGQELRYVRGALENSEIVRQFWPGWILRIYHDGLQSAEVLQLLRERGVELISVPSENISASSGHLWRFLALNKSREFERIIFRDIDARLSERDRSAVLEWCRSPFLFHALHDHPHHTFSIMAGMWGTVSGFIAQEITDLVHNYVFDRTVNFDHLDDQRWLHEVLYPHVKPFALNHESFYCKEGTFTYRLAFPTMRLNSTDYVGNIYSPVNGFKGEVLANSCPQECRREHNWTTC